jgi:hypothetical protein
MKSRRGRPKKSKQRSTGKHSRKVTRHSKLRSKHKSKLDGTKRSRDTTADNKFLEIFKELCKDGSSYGDVLARFLTHWVKRLFHGEDYDKVKYKRIALNTWLRLYNIISKVKIYYQASLIDNDDYKFNEEELEKYTGFVENLNQRILQNIGLLIYTDKYDLEIVRDQNAVNELISFLDITKTDGDDIPERMKPLIKFLEWRNNIPTYGNHLEPFQNLQILKVHSGSHLFQLPDLSNLRNLRALSITGIYSFPLQNLLEPLTNLDYLHLGSMIHPIGNSFRTLTRLRHLSFIGSHTIGNSLETLTQLHTLKIPQYNQPLGDSLRNLTMLRELYLIDFNLPLENALNGLSNLGMIVLPSFWNHPIGNSFRGLSSLFHLELPSFNQHPLGDSLKDLTNLQTLYLNSYSHPLEDSLDALSKLSTLRLNSYNHPLGNSLIKLTNLEALYLNSYTHPLEDSLNALSKLSTLSLDSYNRPLGNSLINLTNLTRRNLLIGPGL